MSSDAEVRQKLSDALSRIRQQIRGGQLILFLGEQTSCLPQGIATFGEWEKQLKGKQDVVDIIDSFELNMTENQQWLHSILRTLGHFPVIITVNPDRLVEHYLIRPGQNVQTVRLDRVGTLKGQWPNNRRVLLIKCNGDASYDENECVMDTSFKYMQEFPGRTTKETEFIQQLFNSHSALFLGCDRKHPVHKAFLEKFVINSQKPHYLFERSSTPSYIQNGELNILQTDMEVNEFTQYLTPGSTAEQLNLTPGQVTEFSFLPTQREEYLQLQLKLEENASEIGFHTAKVTNGLATDEALEAESRPNLEKMFKNDPFIGAYDSATVNGAMAAMYGRRNNLVALLSKGVRVTAIFTYKTFQADVLHEKDQTKCARNIRKYTDVILKARSVLNSQSGLELRVLYEPSPEQEARMKEQYAIIKLKGGSDEAIAYASPAVEGKKNVSINLVSVNGAEVGRKRKIFEESREAAWNHEKSMLNLTMDILKADQAVKALKPDDVNKLSKLNDVQLITKTEIEPGTWEKLGEGSFGSVFKVRWHGRGMAFKVLQKLQNADDLQDFYTEYTNLKRIQHPHVISVADMYHSDDPVQLGIIMEFMGGGSVRDHLQKTLGRGQGLEFTMRCARQVAEALNYLHSQKPAIIHRDIKADNVFMSADHQTFKVGDFGLSRASVTTYQTKTMGWGCYRYMAPEMGRTQKYSPKVDVYAYGLFLLEVVTGSIVFSEIFDNSEVFERAKQGTLFINIPDNIESNYGLNLKKVLISCVESNSIKRPRMSNVLDMLDGKKTVFHTYEEVELLCLGTGKGATAVVHGEPSSSFVILHHGKPKLLVDIGYLLMMKYQELVGKDALAYNLFITHNHSDHSGELPIYLAVAVPLLMKRGVKKSPFHILSGPEVQERLQKHRMHEVYSMPGLEDPDKLATWQSCPADGSKHFIDAEKLFYLQTVKSQHSETGYGFILYYKDHAILGYSGDSGYSKSLFDQIYPAPTVIVDAREKGTYEHAGFDEISKYTSESKHPYVYVTGYGAAFESPGSRYPNIKPLEVGQQYTLWTSQGVPDRETDEGETASLSGSSSSAYPDIQDAVRSDSSSSAEMSSAYPSVEEAVRSGSSTSSGTYVTPREQMSGENYPATQSVPGSAYPPVQSAVKGQSDIQPGDLQSPTEAGGVPFNQEKNN